MRTLLIFLTLITILLLSSTHGLSLTTKVSLNPIAQNKPFARPRKILPTPNSNNNNYYYYHINRPDPFYSVSLRVDDKSPPPPPVVAQRRKRDVPPLPAPEPSLVTSPPPPEIMQLQKMCHTFLAKRYFILLDLGFHHHLYSLSH